MRERVHVSLLERRGGVGGYFAEKRTISKPIQALIPFGTTRKQLQLPSTRAKIPVKTDFGAMGKSQTRMPGEP